MENISFDFEQIRAYLPEGTRSTAPVFEGITDYLQGLTFEGEEPNGDEINLIIVSVADQIKSNLIQISENRRNHTEKDNQDEHEVAEQLLKEHGVNFEEEVKIARRGLDRLVGSLEIVDNSEINTKITGFIRANLDQVKYDHTSTRNTEAGFESSTGDYTVYISPETVVSFAILLSEEFGQEITPDMLKAVITYKLGHENGHIVDALWKNGDNLEQKLSSQDTSNTLLDDFPIRYDTTSEPWKSLYSDMVHERFAGFFAKDLALGMGRNKNTVLDFDVKNLAEPYAIPIHPYLLMASIVYLNSSLSPDEQESFGESIDYLYFNMIAGNTSLAGIEPFTKEVVQQIIAVSIKNSELVHFEDQ